MNKKYEEIFLTMGKATGEDVSNFIEILNTPDEEFEKIYPIFKTEISKVFYSESYQNDLLKKMSIYPIENLEQQKEATETLLSEIDEDTDLTASKKEFIHFLMNSTLSVIKDLLECRRTRIDVKIVKLNENAIIPQYAHPSDAGADICAVEETKIEADKTALVSTGLAFAIPEGYEIQIRPRSGLSAKTGLRIANSPATIDSSYRGEVKIIIHNTGDIPYVIDKGMKIAQLIISPVPMIRWNEVKTIEELGETERGSGGFGSTGTIANEKN